MNTESSPIKPRYDITMSKRTRKNLFSSLQVNEKPRSVVGDPTKDVTLENLLGVKVVDQNDHKKSLKQLINGDEKGKVMKFDEGGNRGRNSLGQHFTEEEKHLQLVRRNQHESVQEGLKLKKLVRRYAKVLSHLMKAKRDPHLGDSGKKPVLKLPK